MARGESSLLSAAEEAEPRLASMRDAIVATKD
jgi:hypothetical protein